MLGLSTGPLDKGLMVTAADSVVQGRRQLELFVTLCLWRSHVQSLSVASTGCHPLSLCLCGQKGVSYVPSLSVRSLLTDSRVTARS